MGNDLQKPLPEYIEAVESIKSADPTGEYEPLPIPEELQSVFEDLYRKFEIEPTHIAYLGDANQCVAEMKCDVPKKVIYPLGHENLEIEADRDTKMAIFLNQQKVLFLEIGNAIRGPDFDKQAGYTSTNNQILNILPYKEQQLHRGLLEAMLQYNKKLDAYNTSDKNLSWSADEYEN